MKKWLPHCKYKLVGSALVQIGGWQFRGQTGRVVASKADDHIPLPALLSDATLTLYVQPGLRLVAVNSLSAPW